MIKYNTILGICFFCTVAWSAQIQSNYTKVDHRVCKVVESDDGGYSSVSVCPGYADIRIEIREGDIRQDMTLVRHKKRYELHFMDKISRSFSYFGPTLEWRFKKESPKKPFAMISRYIASDKYMDGLAQKVSYLVVAKITDKTMCLVGKVHPGKDQNIKARKMADKAYGMACLKDK